MTDNTVCRQAEIEDIEELIELRKVLLNSGDEHYVAKNETQNQAWQNAYRAWLQKFLREERKVVNIYVVEVKAKIIGCATGIIDHRAPMIGALSGKTGWMQSVIVKESWRGQGLTTLLIESLYTWFKHHDVEEIFLQSTPHALRVYKHYGFVEANEALLIKHLDIS